MTYGKKHLTPKQILTDPILFLAFGFGSGLTKKAPGTFGTVAAIPVYLLLVQTSFWFYAIAALVICIVGIRICGNAAEKLGEHDFSGIVWDEIAGLLITLCFVPFSWTSLLIGFILFRVFDILKPWPISWIDKQLDGGLGIMLDDIVAGILAGALLWWFV